MFILIKTGRGEIRETKKCASISNDFTCSSRTQLRSRISFWALIVVFWVSQRLPDLNYRFFIKNFIIANNKVFKSQMASERRRTRRDVCLLVWAFGRGWVMKSKHHSSLWHIPGDSREKIPNRTWRTFDASLYLQHPLSTPFSGDLIATERLQAERMPNKVQNDFWKDSRKFTKIIDIHSRDGSLWNLFFGDSLRRRWRHPGFYERLRVIIF